MPAQQNDKQPRPPQAQRPSTPAPEENGNGAPDERAPFEPFTEELPGGENGATTAKEELASEVAEQEAAKQLEAARQARFMQIREEEEYEVEEEISARNRASLASAEAQQAELDAAKRKRRRNLVLLWIAGILFNPMALTIYTMLFVLLFGYGFISAGIENISNIPSEIQQGISNAAGT